MDPIVQDYNHNYYKKCIIIMLQPMQFPTVKNWLTQVQSFLKRVKEKVHYFIVLSIFVV